MFLCRRLALNILQFLVFAEGLLITTVSSSPNTINRDDAEQLNSTLLQKSGSESKENISKEDLSSCDKCGVMFHYPVDLIINGTKVQPQYRYPWIVALQRNDGTLCGGSLLNANYVLTAAHCLRKLIGKGYIDPEDFQVSFMTSTEVIKPGPAVEKIIPHPEYSEDPPDHDIALVKLSQNVVCDQFTYPICLPNPSQNVKELDVFTTIGWGTFEYGSKEKSEYLLQADIKNLPFTECEKVFPTINANNFYCLRGVNDYQSPCTGDSGGPMFRNIQDKYIIFGVTSTHSHEKCSPNELFLYAPVPNYVQWINDSMKSS